MRQQPDCEGCFVHVSILNLIDSDQRLRKTPAVGDDVAYMTLFKSDRAQPDKMVKTTPGPFYRASGPFFGYRKGDFLPRF